MIKLAVLGGMTVLFCFGSAYAKDNQNIVYMPPSATESYSENSIIALPKFIDDADLNFDELEEEDLFPEEDKAPSTPDKATTSTPPPEPVLPILQKDANDTLPSQKADAQGDGYSKLPVSSMGAEDFMNLENKSLTDTIRDSSPDTSATDEEGASSSAGAKQDNSTDGHEETWLSKLKSPLSSLRKSLSEDSPSLEDMVDDSRQRQSGSNASVFDISGVMLRMSGEQVDAALKKRGFRKVYQKFDIPNFIRWRNEEKCRNQGVVGYERLESCVTETAKKDKHQYVSLTRYAKFNTKEEITVRFTSNFTNNKVYKIIYKSMASTIHGNSQKAIYLRNIKIYDFWKKVNHKYGAPDNKDSVTWGLGGNKPYMQASTGLLILEDPMLSELDYTRMSREDQLFMNTDLYSF